MSALPKVETIKFNLKLDELDQTIKYRAFSNKEHKLILESIEMHEEDTLLNTMIDIVNACTFNVLDIKTLPTHLVDYIYLQIHLKSTGKTQMASYTCGNVIEGEDGESKKCPGAFQLHIPLENARIVYPENFNRSRIVWVDKEKGIGIKMKNPTFNELDQVNTDSDLLDVTDHFIMTCIESVFTSDTILVPGQDFTIAECIEWFDELDGATLRAVANFFKEMPYVGLNLSVTCPICKRKEELELKGIQDFFE